jgi:hypothetical protein
VVPVRKVARVDVAARMTTSVVRNKAARTPLPTIHRNHQAASGRLFCGPTQRLQRR